MIMGIDRWVLGEHLHDGGNGEQVRDAPALHETEDAPGVKVGTCGYERTGMQVSIQDDQGRELKAGETGEICVCGPAVFAGYYDNPEANAKAFRDGWFRTGDLGHLDEGELLGWMDGRLARYKLPRRVFFWDGLPKSAYGKITKKNIRAELEARGCIPLDPSAGASA